MTTVIFKISFGIIKEWETNTPLISTSNLTMDLSLSL